MTLIDHTQVSQSFSGSLMVSVREAKPSGGDEPGIYVGVECAFSHEDHHITQKGASVIVLPIGVLWWVHNPDACQAE
jgi:hypothetical protein